MITAIDENLSGPQLKAVNNGGKRAKMLKLKKACQQFESLFLYYMLKTMHSSSSKSSLFGKGLGSDIFMQMFDEGLAEKMAESGPLGIGNMLLENYAPDIVPDAGKDILRQLNEITAPRSYINSGKVLKKTTGANYRSDEISKVIRQAAEKYNLDPKLVAAVIMQESGGDPQAVSAKGAKGLMQLQDATAKMLGVDDPFDIRQNIFGGAKYLSGLLQKYNGDIEKALAAYNAGPGAVEKYNGPPPYEETKKYITNIMRKLKG